MKKILMVLGAVFIALVVVAISVPFFVDVDKYRPELTAQVNRRIQGNLELGKLKLSLLGGVRVYAEKIVLKVNGYGKPLLDADKVHLEIPFTSILSGHPAIVAVLNAPKIHVEKDAAGTMNLFKLMKPEASAAAPQAPARAIAAAPGNTQLPAFVAAAAFGLRITEGYVNYIDQQSRSAYTLQNLDLNAKDVGLSSTMQLAFTAPLQGKSAVANFDGTVSGEARITPILADGSVRSASGHIYLDATKLNLNAMNGAFVKRGSLPAVLKLNFDGTEKDLLLKNLELKLHDYRLMGKGLFTISPMNLRVELTTDPLVLDKLQDLVPMMAEYRLRGLASALVNLDTNGEKFTLTGDVKVAEGEFSLKDVLKAPLRYTLQAGFTENSLRITKATVSGPDTDLGLTANVSSFTAPVFQANLTGKSLNIDKVVVIPEKSAASGFSLLESAYAAPAPGTVNPLAAMAAKTPALMRAKGDLNAQIGRVVYGEANLESVQARASMTNMVVKVSSASFKAFGGAVAATGDFDLKSAALGYRTQGKATGISAKNAFSAYFPKYKNTVEGTTDADWNLTGGIYPADKRLRSMGGTVKLNARDGIFRSVDFKDTIQQTMQKVPFLKNAKAPNIDEGFKSLNAVANFQSGNIHVEPLNIVGKDKGVDIKGRAKIQESFEHEAFFDISDPRGLLPKEISMPGAVALRTSGPLTLPKIDYEYTVKKLVNVAGKAAAKDAVAKGLGKILGKPDGEKAEGKDAVKQLGDQLKQKFKLKF